MTKFAIRVEGTPEHVIAVLERYVAEAKEDADVLQLVLDFETRNQFVRLTKILRSGVPRLTVRDPSERSYWPDSDLTWQEVTDPELCDPHNPDALQHPRGVVVAGGRVTMDEIMWLCEEALEAKTGQCATCAELMPEGSHWGAP